MFDGDVCDRFPEPVTMPDRDAGDDWQDRIDPDGSDEDGEDD